MITKLNQWRKYLRIQFLIEVALETVDYEGFTFLTLRAAKNLRTLRIRILQSKLEIGNELEGMVWARQP